MVKSDEEIRLIKKTIELNEATLKVYLDHAEAGKPECEAMNAASCFAAEAGAEDQFWMEGTGTDGPPSPLPGHCGPGDAGRKATMPSWS
jgi:Xaa-Pro aminopeptidase